MLSQVFEQLKIDHLLRPFYAGSGVVLMFHRIVPEARRSHLMGLRGLELTPSFFTQVLDYFTHRGFKWLSLNELAKSLMEGALPEHFACVTFDDGYRDNFELAAPLLAARGIPWTVFISTAFINRQLKPWWYALEWLVNNGKGPSYASFDPDLKATNLTSLSAEARYNTLRGHIHSRLGVEGFQSKLGEWLMDMGCPLLNLADELAMDWEQLKKLEHFGGTIGAHTVEHLPMAALSFKRLDEEIRASFAELRQKSGQEVLDFAYPFGDRSSCGLRECQAAKARGARLAFTTRHGWIFPKHANHLWALPRVNVSGHYTSLRHFESRLNGLTNLREHHGRRFVTL